MYFSANHTSGRNICEKKAKYVNAFKVYYIIVRNNHNKNSTVFHTRAPL